VIMMKRTIDISTTDIIGTMRSGHRTNNNRNSRELYDLVIGERKRKRKESFFMRKESF